MIQAENVTEIKSYKIEIKIRANPVKHWQSTIIIWIFYRFTHPLIPFLYLSIYVLQHKLLTKNVAQLVVLFFECHHDIVINIAISVSGWWLSLE